MNKTLEVIYGEVADATGLRIDERTGCLVGVYNGYHVTLGPKNNAYAMYTSVRRNGVLPTKEILKEAKKTVDGAFGVLIEGSNVVVTIGGATKNKTIANMISVVKGMTDFFKAKGLEDVCECCGKPVSQINTYCIKGGVSYLCSDCYSSIQSSMNAAQLQNDSTDENVATGVAGAIIGGLLGALAIIIVGQMGYVAAVSGVILGICTIKGYEMLAKKITTKGFIICGIIMILMTYFGVRMEWTLELAKELDLSFGDAFSDFWPIVDFADARGDIYLELAKAYLFTALGAIPTVLNIVKSKRVAFDAYQIQ